MNRFFTLGTIAAVTGAAMVFAGDEPSPEIADTPGYLITHIDVPHRATAVEVHVWYPTNSTQPAEMIAQNALFNGFAAIPDAAPSDDRSPVVVFSHGSGGKAAQAGWLASHLAAQGMIVVAPNHPGTMSRDSDPHQTPMLWQRTRDLTAVLDALDSGALGGLDADMDRVAAVGFSLGGAAALSLSGARLSKVDFISYCAQEVEKPDCDWMVAAGVNFAAIDATLYQADWSDPRIDAVLAIDPALTQAMTTAGLAGMNLPVLTLGLGGVHTIPAAVDASHLTIKLPNARHVWIEDAAHFSFLPSCGVVGKVATALFGDDDICSDWGLRNRDMIHSNIQDAASTFLIAVFTHPS